MNKFYVYAYLRDNDKTPYYIGKGTGNRYKEKHVVPIPKNRTNIVFLFQNLLEMGSFILERKLIKWYGRKDLGTGILHNRTDGGDGASGRIVSEETKRKSSIANRGQKRSNEAKENIKNALAEIDFTGENNHFFNKKHTDETKKKMSDAKKNKTYEEIYGSDISAKKKQSVSNKLKGRIFPQETLNKMRTPKGPQVRVVCPHCSKEGGVSNMKRHHFDNCRSFETADEAP